VQIRCPSDEEVVWVFRAAMQESIMAKRPIRRRTDFSSRREFLMLPRSFNWKKYVGKTMTEASAVLQQI
jgi:hypothetical protein